MNEEMDNLFDDEEGFDDFDFVLDEPEDVEPIGPSIEPAPENIQPEETQNVESPEEKPLLKLEPYLPKQDTAYQETEYVDTTGDGSLIPLVLDMPAKPTHDHELAMWDAINEFEVGSWSTKAQGIKTGWQSMDDAFDGGIKSGFIIVGGDSNIGKSAVMCQMAWQIAENNDDVYVMDFSLDDPMPDKLARMIGAGSKVLLNAVKNPTGYQDMPIMLARRKKALNKLRSHVDRYRAYDANFSTFIEDIEEEVQRIIIELDSLGIQKRVVVFIDNMHDLNVKANPGLSEKDKFNVIAQWCADLAIKYDIPLICTAELKKLNGTRRPQLDDIRDNVKIKYEAKAVLLAYNEVHYKGDAADVYYMKQSSPLKQPVLELHFAKNKMHSFKGRIFFEFYPEMARLEEPDPQTVKHYAGLAYNN